MKIIKNSIVLTVSFRKIFSEDGAVYTKCISIPQKVFDAFMLSLQSERAIELDFERKTYLCSQITSRRNLRFLNLTQSKYLISWAKRQYEIKVDVKRLESGFHNTCILIK